MLAEELANHAPIRELRVNDIEAREVAADTVLEITDKGMFRFFASLCTYPLNA